MKQSTDTNLSDTQLILLSAASQRDDGMIPLHDRLKGAVVTHVGERLIGLGPAEEQLAERGQPNWRETADGERLALVITRHGLAAIGVDEPAVGREDGDPVTTF